MLNEKQIIEVGKLAQNAEPYINLLIQDITNEILEAISHTEPKMDYIRAKVLARNILVNRFKYDTERAIDVLKNKQERKEL